MFEKNWVTVKSAKADYLINMNKVLRVTIFKKDPQLEFDFDDESSVTIIASKESTRKIFNIITNNQIDKTEE